MPADSSVIISTRCTALLYVPIASSCCVLGHFILVQKADTKYKTTYLGDRFLVLLEL